ncbi:MAG: hypothetical protein CFH22_00964 [Alphaproteobacteria bacterium MarineAlpha5_Bin12]|nr:hypothetical protein [Pelagibacteraceae bacterium]PPR41042.1 MAG: hypothetical protein CFH22_00964 [Alphaproteobacteria bacterium MarineAlpha5_Bin12]
MYSKINLQYVISYFGLIPYFFILLINKDIISFTEKEIVSDFIIYYTLIISVFIGSMNWNLQQKIPAHLVIYGFLPSIFAVIIIILNLLNYSNSILYLSLMTVLIAQLIFDYIIIFKNKKNNNVFYFLRLPLTTLIVLTLIAI